MSRSGYSDDCDDTWSRIRWRGAVASAIRGKRGQAFLLEMYEALEEMRDQKLITGALEDDYGDVCALGAVGRARGQDMSHIKLDDDDDDDGEAIGEEVAAFFEISTALAREIMWLNDECWWRSSAQERYERMKRWIAAHLLPVEG